MADIISSGDTAWLLASTALVMIMTPGVGFFYGGLVRRKNLVSMITLSFIAFALVSVQWVLFGYSLAFAPDFHGLGLIGGLDFLGLNGVGQQPAVIAGTALTVPALAYMVFQLVFATVTLAIVTSVFAERVKLSSFIVFGLLWTTLVYDPLAHWVWGGGWVSTMGTLFGQTGGAIDFAGGTVVHISSGFSALAIALIIRKRVGFGKDLMEPSNIPIALLGATLLWFGWFGFNAGSAVAANGLAASAFVVTNTATAAAALTWMFLSWARKGGRPSSLSFASGAVAGLVAITPASGYVGPLSAIVIGVVASCICYCAMLFRIGKGLDESCDCWSVHGVGGLWGALATGLFASVAIDGVHSGLIFGHNGYQMLYQIIAVCSSVTYAFVVTAILIFILDKTIGMTVKEEEEYVGLDISQHGERAYS